MSERSSSRRQRRGKTKPTNTERAILSGAVGCVLIVIALCAQLAFGLNVLNREENNEEPTAPPIEENGGPSGAIRPIPGGYDGGWFQVYFTSPINSQDESRFKDAPIENALVAALDGAQQTIDAAVFELNSQPVTDALIRAHQRGVTVRMVTDGDHGLERPDATFDQIDLEDIPITSDGARGGFMHDKFFVIDGQLVWTGSTNIQHNDLYNNNNNSILIRSSRLAANYTAEFEELFAGQFGKSSPTGVPNPVVNLNGATVETYFESEGDAPARLAELFKSAHSVRFMAFSFTEGLVWKDGSTERAIMDLLVDRAQAGEIDLLGIIEASSRRFVKPLYCALGDDIHQDGNPDVLHHKVFIIDSDIVVMGSFNFSDSAMNDNDENMLIITSPDLATIYLEEFDRRWSESDTMPASAFNCQG